MLKRCYRTIKDLRASYVDTGQEQPILIIASPLVLANAYQPLIQTLSSDFRVVVLKLPVSYSFVMSRSIGDKFVMG